MEEENQGPQFSMSVRIKIVSPLIIESVIIYSLSMKKPFFPTKLLSTLKLSRLF